MFLARRGRDALKIVFLCASRPRRVDNHVFPARRGRDALETKTCVLRVAAATRWKKYICHARRGRDALKDYVNLISVMILYEIYIYLYLSRT